MWLVSESWGHPSCVLAHPCQACEGSRALRPVLSPESLLQARGLRRLLRFWGAEGVQRGGGGQCPRGCWVLGQHPEAGLPDGHGLVLPLPVRVDPPATPLFFTFLFRSPSQVGRGPFRFTGACVYVHVLVRVHA